MTEIILCECSSSEHQVIFKTVDYSEEELEEYHPSLHKELKDEVYMDIHLVRRSFWYRVKYAWKYIWGYKSRYGAWDEILTTKTKLRQLVDRLDNNS